VKIRPIALFILAIALSASCTQKNLNKDFNRLIVGKWKLSTLTKGAEEVKAYTNTTFYFTADRQMIINNNDKEQKTSYFIRENILNVNDGIITDIQEELKIEHLDNETFTISFKIDGQEAKMNFKKIN
jgi:hypothetical protein